MLRFVFFLVLFAAVVYAFFWLLQRRNDAGGPGGTGGPGGGGSGPRGPLGPDDDDDFLRELDRKRRRPRTEPPEDS